MSARDDYPAVAVHEVLTLHEGYNPQYTAALDEIDRLRNALKWIRQTAMIHYIGDAFDPVHMAELAEMALDALGGKPIDDFDAVMADAKVQAAKWKELFREGST